jgi:hypothetical protein
MFSFGLPLRRTIRLLILKKERTYNTSRDVNLTDIVKSHPTINYTDYYSKVKVAVDTFGIKNPTPRQGGVLLNPPPYNGLAS